MPDQPHHLIPEEFAGNEWLVDELFEKYQADKNSVDKKWSVSYTHLDVYKRQDQDQDSERGLPSS